MRRVCPAETDASESGSQCPVLQVRKIAPLKDNYSSGVSQLCSSWRCQAEEREDSGVRNSLSLSLKLGLGSRACACMWIIYGEGPGPPGSLT